MIVARSPGGAKKATSYAERLRLAIAVIHGEQKLAELDTVDGRNSPPPMRTRLLSESTSSHNSPPPTRTRLLSESTSKSRTMDGSVGVPPQLAKEKPHINVVGDVGGRIAIMVVSSRKTKNRKQRIF